MADELKSLEPLKTPYRLQLLSNEKLTQLQEATFEIENISLRLDEILLAADEELVAER